MLRVTADSSLFAIDAALRGEGGFLGRHPFIDGYLKSGELVEVFERPFHLKCQLLFSEYENTKNAGKKNKVTDWLKSSAAEKS